MHKLLNQPLEVIEDIKLGIIIDELADAGADKAVMSFSRHGINQPPVAAIALVRGDDTQLYLNALDKVAERPDVDPDDQRALVDIARDMAAELESVIVDAEDAGCDQPGIAEVLDRWRALERRLGIGMLALAADADEIPPGLANL